jgi:hypothetical protein
MSSWTRSGRPRRRSFRPESPPFGRRQAIGARPQFGLGRQIKPSKSKPTQIKPSKITWFYLVLFVRIGTFQWVTANPNKKSFPYRTLRRLKPAPSDSSSRPASAQARVRFRTMYCVARYCVARNFRFSKQLFLFFCLSGRPPGPVGALRAVSHSAPSSKRSFRRSCPGHLLWRRR